MEAAANRGGTIRDGPLEELARIYRTAAHIRVRQGEKTCLNGFSS